VAVPASLPRRDEPLPLTITVRAGATLVRQGDPCSIAWVVRSGALWESIVLADGRELALGVLGPGQLVGEPEGAPGATSVQTLRVSRLVPVDPDRVAGLFAERARRTATLAAELAWSTVPSRLQARLHDLAARFGRPVPGGTDIGLRLTQDQLAQLCGSTRETVNRALQQLSTSGEVHTAGLGRYVVRDRPVAALEPVGDPAP
jgi:CRP-like cAMP-binding protein